MTTNETNPIVRWLVIAVLSAATTAMVAVSLRANYLFGYGFGQTAEKAHVFGCPFRRSRSAVPTHREQ